MFSGCIGFAFGSIIKKAKVKVHGFYIATLTQLTSTALHSRQVTGKNEEQKVERRCVTAAPGEPYDRTQTHTQQPITQLNVPVTARKDFNPQPKLVPNYTAC